MPTLTVEKRFVVLASIVDLGGTATKKAVLDNIDKNQYMSFSTDDLRMKTNRKELHWRNDLAYVRKGLADAGYIDDSTYDQWKITDSGLRYLETLSDILLDAEEDGYQKLTSSAIQRAAQAASTNTTEYKSRKQEFDEDEIAPPNENKEARVRRIKRYKKIVDDLKAKYQGCCQVEGCGFTFEKKNGGYYAEGHHLIPLARGGTQNKQNVVILCANHHRMFHYANVIIGELSNDRRPITINNVYLSILYL